MAIRLQPRKIEAPAGEPFKHDLLDREEPIKALTTMIESTEGPRVLAVDAGWGMGKTTFLDMWAQYLRDKKFPVVQFNAWQTDFAESPFLALTAEITDSLQEEYSDHTGQSLEKLKDATAEVLRRLPGILIRLAAASIPQVGSQAVTESKAFLESMTDLTDFPFRVFPTAGESDARSS